MVWEQVLRFSASARLAALNGCGRCLADLLSFVQSLRGVRTSHSKCTNCSKAARTWV